MKSIRSEAYGAWKKSQEKLAQEKPWTLWVLAVIAIASLIGGALWIMFWVMPDIARLHQ